MINFLENNENRPFAFVPMCADPIHVGHINILNVADQYGSVVVGLMTDEAMASYKRKPISSYYEREAVVKHLDMVDFVYPLEDGINYAKVASRFKLDFFLHGDDWLENNQKKSRENLIDVMKVWNGQVIDVKYTEGISSTIYNSKI